MKKYKLTIIENIVSGTLTKTDGKGFRVLAKAYS